MQHNNNMDFKLIMLNRISLKMRAFNHGLFMAAVLALSGCVTDPVIMEMEDTLRAYSSTIRWSNFANAPHFQGKDVEQKPLNIEKLKSIRVTAYTERYRKVAEDKNEVNIMVEIRYYDENFAKEHTITDNQKWIYDDDLSRWALTSELPGFFYQ